jgi:alpha-glucosidase (family GH31 glycosyl hydrolase)
MTHTSMTHTVRTRPAMTSNRQRTMRALAAIGVLALSGSLALTGTASASSRSAAPALNAASKAAPNAAATTDTSPVNLSTTINTANGKAAQSATVVEGDARFEVLTPEVVRLEYSPTGSFVDTPSFNILDRDFTVPSYTTSVQNGWLVLATADMVLKYQLGSGPFNAVNTQMQLLDPLPPGASASVSPTWEWECTFGQVCQSGAATLAGAAALANDHQNFASAPGFVAGLTAAGASASWQVLGAPSGTAAVTIRYSNGETSSQTIDLVVNGASTKVTLPVTGSWNTWSTVTEPVTLTSGTNTVATACNSDDSCNVNIDTIAAAASGTTAAPYLPANPLGGYMRSYDSVNGSYSASPACAAGQSGATCAANIPQTATGLLDKSGWYLLDDTQTDLWTSTGWIAPRPTGGDAQDGYLFGYGQNYSAALSDLAKLTGPTPMLPESLFGTWFSRYYAYSAADYENTLLPQFAANGVTLDNLSADTDWKSPNTWDGLEWNASLFPDPSAFLSWAQSQDVNVALNLHSSVATNDPAYAQAQSVAGNTLTTGSCDAGTTCAVWDWGNVAQAESYFDVEDPTQNAASFTWLDWCCDASYVSTPGITPDSWINHLTAQQMVDSGERGFVLSRIGASYQNSQAGAYPSGPWAEHRSTVAFTGDTQGTWNTLASEAQLTQAEGSIGEPYVSDDIGSFLGPPSGGANDPDDLYLRWLQLGTFQPIMREHSNAGQNPRLPWEYDAATQAVGDQFLQLRSELVPYLYTLSNQSATTGLPMAQALYLDYPTQAAAYTNPTEYLLGPNMLVAPVTTPGDAVAAQVWFPPGAWEDYFTGATFTGPATETIDMPTSRMPVFVKAGGIVPLQPSASHASAAGSAPLTLRVYAGGSSSYSMYDDAGTGLGYQNGQSTETPISYAENSSAGTSTVTVGPATGSYPGEPASRSYTVDLIDLSQPTSVQLNGATLPTSGWTYTSATHTLQVPIPATSTSQTATVTQTGGSAVTVAEPPVTPSTAPVITSVSPSTAAAGQQVTVTGTGFGATQNSSYLTFSDGGTNWGAPADEATFTVDSWSDTAITFTVPTPSGANNEWAVTPGSTATVSVTNSVATSGTSNIAIRGTGPIVSGVSSSLCMDDKSASTADYNPIQIYTCNATSAQQWTVAAGNTLQVLGKCMDVNDAGTADGTLVDLYDCNGTVAQVWQPQSDGALLNPDSGKCLDDPNASTTSGTQLEIYDCNSTNAQDWTLP